MKNIVKTRIILLCIVAILCTCLAVAFSPKVSVEWGCIVLDILCDVSAVLFGVFGIWLGMFYNPTVQTSLNGKEGPELKETAEHIVASAQRFRIVFRGMVISALVLVFAMLVRTLHDPLSHMASSWHPILKDVLRCAFFFLVNISVIAQCYSIIMSVVPMYDAKKKMAEAQKKAELVISL